MWASSRPATTWARCRHRPAPGCGCSLTTHVRLARYWPTHGVSATGWLRRITATLERDGLGANYASVPWDSPACRVLRMSIEDVTGSAPASYPTHFAGDIRYPIRLAGVPAFGMGSLAGGFYGPDEWVDIDDLVRLVAIVMVCADRWAALG